MEKSPNTFWLTSLRHLLTLGSSYISGCQPELILFPSRHLAMSGGSFGCHSSEDAIGSKRVEARDAAKYPTMPRTAPQQRTSVVLRLRHPERASGSLQGRGGDSASSCKRQVGLGLEPVAFVTCLSEACLFFLWRFNLSSFPVVPL